MLVIEIAYKYESGEAYTLLPIRLMSGSISLQGSPSRSGFNEQAECNAYIPYLSDEMDAVIFKLSKLGGIFIVKDTSNLFHELGNDEVKAMLKYKRINPGQPGGKYGYELQITFSSPSGIPVQSFNSSAS
jgi:hypothetical protein